MFDIYITKNLHDIDVQHCMHEIYNYVIHYLNNGSHNYRYHINNVSHIIT